MAQYTNIGTNLVHTHDNTPMIPWRPAEVSDECAANARFQEMVTDGDIVAGDGGPDPKTIDASLPTQLGMWS